MDTKQIDNQQYFRRFNKRVRVNALKQAYEIRKFEIELYWKRATYFWTFIGVSFVAYAAVANAHVAPSPGVNDHRSILLVIACIGSVFSVAWHCVNKGSKFWQENWENHVELLEDEHFGPLYKTFSRRPNAPASMRSFLIDPEPFSVSKINQIVSAYVAITWLCLLAWSARPIRFFDGPVDWAKTLPVGLAMIACIAFWTHGKSHHGGHSPVMFVRKTALRGARRTISSALGRFAGRSDGS